MHTAFIVVFWWGLFGIFIETFWTMLRKFKRKAFRQPLCAPLRVVCRLVFNTMRRWYRRWWRQVKNWPYIRALGKFVSVSPPRCRRPSAARCVARSVVTHSPFALQTETNGWTFLMFGFGMPCLITVGEKMCVWGVPRSGRFVVYGLGFWGVEILFGTFIRWLGARVPWDYSASSSSALNGLIRKDYFWAWGILGLLVERFFSYWVYEVLVPATSAALLHMPAFLPLR